MNDRDEGFLIYNVKNIVLFVKDDYDADYSLDPLHIFAVLLPRELCVTDQRAANAL